MTPDPKKKRISLNQAGYQWLRRRACKRAMGHCEECFDWTPYNNGHLHHIKSRGAGGDDTLDNVLWLCYLCHDKYHR